MEETLDSRNVDIEFLDVTSETVCIGYRSHQSDMTNLFTELQVVVRTVLEHEPGTAIMGAIFHTERPIIGTWQVDATWAEKRQNGDLSEIAVTTQVLHTLRTVQF